MVDKLTQLLTRVGGELEKAALILACETQALHQAGHVKAGELDKLRSKLNTIIRSLKPNESRTGTTRR